MTAVVELIADEIATRCGNVNDVSEVVRPKQREAYTPKDKQIVITQADPEIDQDLSIPGNPPATAYVQRFDLRCHIRVSEQSADPVDESVNDFMSAVIVAVGTSGDANPWHTFGGLAINARFGDQENMGPEDGVDGVIIPVLVTYRTDETNPSNVRM